MGTSSSSLHSSDGCVAAPTSGNLWPAEPTDESSLIVVVQNLEKKAGLAGQLAGQYLPDVMLLQEINLSTENAGLFGDAYYTSRMGYGTAIHCKGMPANVRRVKSPTAEFGGFIKKKTTVAQCMELQCVSFHGYNGTPSRDVAGLVAHVKAVLEVLVPGPSIFAGDFNTWTREHLHAVVTELSAAGLVLACSWEYPGRDHPLDHFFVRGLKLLRNTTFKNGADHLGAIFEVARD